ncbi:Uncharacterised protein [Bordetella trematum]|nr:Uncharacterised protein [Bordetella trematum]
MRAPSGQGNAAHAEGAADRYRHRHRGDVRSAVGTHGDGRRGQHFDALHAGTHRVGDLILGQRHGDGQGSRAAQRYRSGQRHRRDMAVDAGAIQRQHVNAAHLPGRARIADARRDVRLDLIDCPRAGACGRDRQAQPIDDRRRIGHRDRRCARHHHGADMLFALDAAIRLQTGITRLDAHGSRRDLGVFHQRLDHVGRFARAHRNHLAGAVDVMANDVFGHGHANGGRGRAILAGRHGRRHAQHNRIDMGQAFGQHPQRLRAAVDHAAADVRIDAGRADVARQRAAAADGRAQRAACGHGDRGAKHHGQDVAFLQRLDRYGLAAEQGGTADFCLDGAEHLVDRHAGADGHRQADCAGLHTDRSAQRNGRDAGLIFGRHLDLALRLQHRVDDARTRGDLDMAHRYRNPDRRPHASGPHADRHAQCTGHGHDAAVIARQDLHIALVAAGRHVDLADQGFDLAIYRVAATGSGAGAGKAVAGGDRSCHADRHRNDPGMVIRPHQQAIDAAERGAPARRCRIGAIDGCQRVIADVVVRGRDAGRNTRARAGRHGHADAACHCQDIAVVVGAHRNARSAADCARLDLADIADAGLVTAVQSVDRHRAAHRHSHGSGGRRPRQGEVMNLARELAVHADMAGLHQALGVTQRRVDGVRAHRAERRAAQIVVRQAGTHRHARALHAQAERHRAGQAVDGRAILGLHQQIATGHDVLAGRSLADLGSDLVGQPVQHGRPPKPILASELPKAAAPLTAMAAIWASRPGGRSSGRANEARTTISPAADRLDRNTPA